MYIQLEEDNLVRIAEEIACSDDTDNGSFYYSPLEIEVRFKKRVYSHMVGDYESGYSERVIDDVEFEVKSIELSDVSIEYDSYFLDKLIEELLWKQ